MPFLAAAEGFEQLTRNSVPMTDVHKTIEAVWKTKCITPHRRLCSRHPGLRQFATRERIERFAVSACNGNFPAS